MSLKQYLSVLLTFSAFSVYSAEDHFPEVIDFNRSFIPSAYPHLFEDPTWSLGHYAFNYAPELTSYFAMLKQTYTIDTVVETGTYFGCTTALFAQLYSEVHTVEVVEDTYRMTKQFLDQLPNVHCHLGSSEKILSEILPSLQDKPVLFYLDAHWYDNWPLLQELEAISKTHKDNCIIVVDDFKVPGRGDIPYDQYSEKECSFEYIRSQLDKVFTDYTIHYLIPCRLTSRAKFVAIPKHWKPITNL